MASPFDFPVRIDDKAVRARAVQRLRENGVRLPTFTELAEPQSAPASARAALAGVDPDAAHAANLYRVNWYNGWNRTEPTTLPA